MTALVPIAGIRAAILVRIELPIRGNRIEIRIAPRTNVLGHGLLAINTRPEVVVL